MVKTEPGGTLRRKPSPVGECCVEQNPGALDVGLDERGRSVDRTVDMRFGREMENGVGVEFLHSREHRLPIADIGSAKDVARICFDRPKRPEIGRIGELVDIQYRGAEFAIRVR